MTVLGCGRCKLTFFCCSILVLTKPLVSESRASDLIFSKLEAGVIADFSVEMSD